VTKRIERCAATNVDPATGVRDLSIPKLLMRHLGYADCGVYAEVVRGGAVAEGERLTLEEPVQAALL
jgi:MOSC domain-containing protein YiiM